MKISEFDYPLPKRYIAQRPVKPRHNSRLMVLNGSEIRHKRFFDIIEYLNKDDTLLINDSRVIPARLFGRKRTGGRVEILLLKRVEGNKWECLARGKGLHIGTEISFQHSLKGIIIEKTGEKCIIDFQGDGDFDEIIERIGETPTPPYIKRSASKEEYQTVYARYSGSVAAPTAGLHFTEELLDKIKKKGVNIASLTLHVGYGTFKPVKVGNIEKHEMEEEYFRVNEKNVKIINDTKKSGGRLIAVGTTTVRALESACNDNGFLKPMEGWADLFIYPGYRFKSNLDGLITNFHLPKSTLLMLVSAFIGRERILEAYREAISRSYRFYSFGDAMFMVKEDKDVRDNTRR